MAGENREFNPMAFKLVQDRDVDDESVVNVDTTQPGWPEISTDVRNQLTQVQRLDGLVIASESMQIAKNCKLYCIVF